MLQLETAGLSDIGKKRDHQEDAFLVDDKRRLYVVADGMGGHLAGEVASAIIIDTLQTAVADPGYHPPAERDVPLTPEGSLVLNWISSANRNVYLHAQRDEQCRGMGSTIAALYFTDNRVVAANVGDSPMYLVRDNGIKLISAIHTVAAEQAGYLQGQALLPEQFQHALTRAVGTHDSVQPYIHQLPCCADDVYIICSDGLSNAVETEEMHAIVRQCSARDACARLIDLANARGGDDNSTVIVIKIRD